MWFKCCSVSLSSVLAAGGMGACTLWDTNSAVVCRPFASWHRSKCRDYSCIQARYQWPGTGFSWQRSRLVLAHSSITSSAPPACVLIISESVSRHPLTMTKQHVENQIQDSRNGTEIFHVLPLTMTRTYLVRTSAMSSNTTKHKG